MNERSDERSEVAEEVRAVGQDCHVEVVGE
jgi:hypothetical protein